MSVQDLIDQSITKTEGDFRSVLFKHVVLTGGNSMFEGFSDRLGKELAGKTEDEVKIYPEADPINSVFIGCSIFASLSTFDD